MKQLLYFLLGIVVFITIAISLFINLAPQIGAKPKGEHLAEIAQSPQYHETRFENKPYVKPELSFKDSMSALWAFIKGSDKREPDKKLLSYPLQLEAQDEGAHLTWFGHSTFFYETAGKRIMFDPMLSEHASPLPFMIGRYDYDIPASVEDLPPLDIVIISHDHYDHLDYNSIKALGKKTKHFVTPLGVGAHLQHWGISKEAIIELDWDQQTAIDKVNITAVRSQHFSGRSINDTQKTLWAAFIIDSPQAKVFFGGDSGYFEGFKGIGQKYGPFDLTLLDSGQYNKAWSDVHMFPEQSVKAHQQLQGEKYMPMHWSAFTLSVHDWTDPVERALIAADKANVDIITPIIGERFNVITDTPNTKWWREE